MTEKLCGTLGVGPVAWFLLAAMLYVFTISTNRMLNYTSGHSNVVLVLVGLDDE